MPKKLIFIHLETAYFFFNFFDFVCKQKKIEVNMHFLFAKNNSNNIKKKSLHFVQRLDSIRTH